MTKEEALNQLNKCLPHPQQLTIIDMSKENAIYFKWRHNYFKLDLHSQRIDEHDGLLLSGSTLAILMTHCFKTK